MKHRNLVVQWQRVTDHMRRGLFGMSRKHFCQIKENVFLGGQPTKRGFAILATWGVTAVISMRSSRPKKVPQVMQLLHLPTPDHGPIALSDLQKAIEFINKQIRKNGKVYVHCHWGEGRAASVAAAYLVSTGMSASEAVAYIKQRRVFIKLNKSQLERLNEFAKTY